MLRFYVALSGRERMPAVENTREYLQHSDTK
jgi:hypothetical protein